MKKYQLKWTLAARADLKDIKQYISQHAPKVAVAYVRRIRERCLKLTTLPFAHPIVAEYGNDSIRETYHGSYRIIYRIDDDCVTVLRVFHGARQLPDRPPGE